MDLLLLRCLIPGFIVMLCLSRLLLGKPDELQSILFQRVLFQVIETYLEQCRSGSLRLPVDKILALDDCFAASSTASLEGPEFRPKFARPAGMASMTSSELVSYDLLGQESLDSLRQQPEFHEVETRSGPALAVAVHYLPRYGRVYPTPVICFNAMKVNQATRKAILNPKALEPGPASDSIKQM